jgi:hypothetical protein
VKVVETHGIIPRPVRRELVVRIHLRRILFKGIFMPMNETNPERRLLKAVGTILDLNASTAMERVADFAEDQAEEVMLEDGTEEEWDE